jgi:hypothetical protein
MVEIVKVLHNGEGLGASVTEGGSAGRAHRKAGLALAVSFKAFCTSGVNLKGGINGGDARFQDPTE